MQHVQYMCDNVNIIQPSMEESLRQRRADHRKPTSGYVRYTYMYTLET